MEKFSAYRDAGTGIQPFLNPVSPPDVTKDTISTVLLPLRAILGVLRMMILAIILLLHIVLVDCICRLIPLKILSRLCISITTRTALLVLGFWWIQAEYVTRKRTKGYKPNAWHPRQGDVIVSNFVSWIEVLWLAFRFNPTFVIPHADSRLLEPSISMSGGSEIQYTPGRKTGTGSAHISLKQSRASRMSITGFSSVSLLRMIAYVGNIPMSSQAGQVRSLEEVRSTFKGPIVVFPECTTSNGRGVLRFAHVFKQNIQKHDWKIFVMCVRYDPPTSFTPSCACSIPSTSLNPLPHIFKLACSLSSPKIFVRLLDPTESPGSPSFSYADFESTLSHADQLTDCCAYLISQVGRMKQLGLGWEDKTNFLAFYRGNK